MLRSLLHKECLLSWARACTRSNQSQSHSEIATCPLCKASMLPNGADVDDECCSCCLPLGEPGTALV